MGNKTRKHKPSSHSIVFNKYEKEVLGVKARIYVIHLHKKYSCRPPITLKKVTGKIRRFIAQKLHVLDYLEKHKVFSKHLPKTPDLTSKILKDINTKTKYTYCLNKDTLIFAETRTNEDHAILKDWLSKHVVLCSNNACASGEMVIHNNTFIFDNNSGSYFPSMENLKTLKKALGSLHIKIVDMDSEEHAKYFIE